VEKAGTRFTDSRNINEPEVGKTPFPAHSTPVDNSPP